ncbi:MAG: ABC transporter permease [Lentisphaerae bacterium]|nr:ABC transporter permease [Lentisphaerota bacterium]
MKTHAQKTRAGGRSLWSDAWARIRRQWLTMACLSVIVIFTLIALYGEVVHWRYRIVDVDAPAWMKPVHSLVVKALRAESVVGEVAPYHRQDLDKQFMPPSFEHPMGTDGLGRDVSQRVIQGVRIAFQVGIVTSLIAIPIGVILGCLAGYFGGRLDDLVVWLYTTFACMPSLLFILAIAMVVGKGLLGVYIGIGFTTWVGLCRLMRAEVMKHKERTYVKAARSLGLGHMRILFFHILPNVFHLVIISFSLRFPAAIGTEVFISFLGIGVQGEPSWGIMIGNARLRLWYGVWWELGFTTLAIFLVVLAFNLFGDALRDALDPRLRSELDAQ